MFVYFLLFSSLSFVYRDGIVSPFGEGIASQDAPCRQEKPSDGSPFFQSLQGRLGAGGDINATGRLVRGDIPSVKTDGIGQQFSEGVQE